MRKILATCVAAGLLAVAGPAMAREHGIGDPVVAHGLILHAVYLQPVHMAPTMPGMDQGNYDAHLELDVHADKDNGQGFPPGSWIPYLTVSYQISKQDSDWSTFGTMMAMSANDGPHYGQNVRFHGPGKYTLRVKILPAPYNGFLRHTDKETGVKPWWAPIEQSWTFTYVGSGHKGGY